MAKGVRGTMPPHGNYGRYTNHGCRCAECREAWRVYSVEFRHRRGYNKPRDEYLDEVRSQAQAKPCGTESKYAWGCRCDECRKASTEARLQRRRRNINHARAYDRAYKAAKRAAKQAAA